MARQVEEIQEQIINLKNNTSVLSDLNSNSVTAIWRLWTYIVAVAIRTLELLYDVHRTEMETLYSQQHAHTLEWYNTKAKNFMLGKQLINFTGNYDTTGMADDEIDTAHIVSYAACVRARRANNTLFLRMKVAKGTDTARENLTDPELQAFTDYMYAIQDAGVDLECESRPADHIQATLTVYYNPQILDKDGNRLDGTASDVVKQAIIEYIQNLPFNGLLIPAYLIDAVQAVDGVMVPDLTMIQTQVDGSGQWLQLTESIGRIAEAGWYKFYNDSDLQITYIPFDNGNI